jgi:hypothetical protein
MMTEWLLLSVFLNLKTSPPLMAAPEVAGRYDTGKDCQIALQWAERTIDRLKLPDKDLGEIRYGCQPLPPRWPHEVEAEQSQAQEPKEPNQEESK